MSDNSVFISYRRNVNTLLALTLYQHLRARGVDAFIDIEPNHDDTHAELTKRIMGAHRYFMLVLTPGSVEHATEPLDPMRREIEQAAELDRAPVPLVSQTFNLKDLRRYLPFKRASALLSAHAVKFKYDKVDDSIHLLLTSYMKPTKVPVTPLSDEDRAEYERKRALADAIPPITPEQLSAQDRLERAMGLPESAVRERIRELDEAVKLYPDYAEAYTNRGVAHYDADDYPAALADFDRAIALNPDLVEAYVNRGVAREKSDDYKGALEDLNHAVKLNPNFATAYYNRGIVRTNRKDYTRAISDYNKAISLFPEFAAAINNRGWARHLRGTSKQALEDSNAAIEIAPDEPEFYHTRGSIKAESGDYAGATADYMKALQLDPMHKKASEMREKLSKWGTA
jgi:tetratricopeptide (TPR) repeat protein